MKLKYNFIVNEIADKKVAVTVGEDTENFNGMIRLNNTAAFIFDMLKEDVTEDEIVAAMKEKYDAEEEQLRQTVHSFIETLQKSNVLE